MNAMAPSAELTDALDALPSLRRALDEDHAGMAVIRSDGTWHLEQNGAVRVQPTALGADEAAHLVDVVRRNGPACCLDGWWVRPIGGGEAATLLFERRPDANPTGLAPHTVELLRTQIPPGANGLIFGNAGPARSGVLLSLIQSVPADLVLYIGPVPPVVPAELSLVHICPPRHDRDRRELASLFQRASAVLWDGAIAAADIRLLLGGHNPTHRWLTVDAASPDDWATRFPAASRLQAPITTHIGVHSSPLHSVRIDHLAIRRHGDWEVLFDHDELSEPGTTDPDTDESIRSSRISAEVTSPIDHRRIRAAAKDTASTGADDDGDGDDRTRSPEQGADDHPPESGEIDVPGFTPRHRSSPESTEDEQPPSQDVSDALRGQRIDDELPGLVASSDIDDVEIPELAPEQLRQTYTGPADTESLQRERQRQRAERDDDGADVVADPPDQSPPPDSKDDSGPVTRPFEADAEEEPTDGEADPAEAAPADQKTAIDRAITVTTTPDEEEDNSKATTVELGAFSKRDVVESGDGSDE